MTYVLVMAMVLQWPSVTLSPKIRLVVVIERVTKRSLLTESKSEQRSTLELVNGNTGIATCGSEPFNHGA